MFRTLQAIGIIRSLLLIFFITFGFIILAKVDTPYISVAVFFIVIYTYHSNRLDKDYLRINTSYPIFIYWIEYLIISTPFSMVSLFRNEVVDILYCILIIIAAPLLFNIQVRVPKLSFPFFRKGSYEFQLMFRRNYFWLLSSYLVSIVGIVNNNERVLYFSVAVFSIISLLSTTTIMIPPFYIKMYRTEKEMIRNKILNILYNLTILYIPFFIIGVFHIYTILTIYIITLFLFIAFNMLKYYFDNNMLLVCIYGLLGVLPLTMSILYNPLFVFLPLIVNIFLKYKAVSKLKPYFQV